MRAREVTIIRLEKIASRETAGPRAPLKRLALARRLRVVTSPTLRRSIPQRISERVFKPAQAIQIVAVAKACLGRSLAAAAEKIGRHSRAAVIVRKRCNQVANPSGFWAKDDIDEKSRSKEVRVLLNKNGTSAVRIVVGNGAAASLNARG